MRGIDCEQVDGCVCKKNDVCIFKGICSSSCSWQDVAAVVAGRKTIPRESPYLGRLHEGCVCVCVCIGDAWKMYLCSSLVIDKADVVGRKTIPRESLYLARLHEGEAW